MNSRCRLLVVASGLLADSVVAADVVEFEEFAAWSDAADAFSTIGFFELPEFSNPTTEYEDLGIVFHDGEDWTVSTSSFVIDGWGLMCVGGSYDVSFLTPHTSLAIYFPGAMVIELYSDEVLIYTSTQFGGGGAGNFGGLISDVPFDSARLHDPIDNAGGLDDLYFGAPSAVGDLNDDGLVNVSDLVSLITAWGPCGVGGKCPADLNGDNTVNVGDLLLLILNWSP